MYKLMVVEDEDVIRNGIVKSVDWDTYGFTISGCAANGKEAMEKIHTNIPDVVLTDVRMPLVDGLELARWINENYYHIKILILSGYADFEYAKSAIRFKVFEYLLKPTNKKIFLETFTRLKSEMDEERKEIRDMEKNQKKLKEGLVKLRQEFILGILNGNVPSATILEDRFNYLELDLTGSSFSIAVLRINAQLKDYPAEWQSDPDLLSYTITNIINEILEESGCGIGIVKELNEIVIIFNNNDKTGAADKKRIIGKCIEHIYKMVLKNRRIIIDAGIGLPYPRIIQLNKSYRQALKALEKTFFKRQSNFHFYSDSEEPDVIDECQWINSYPSEIDGILTEVMNGNRERTVFLIQELFKYFLSNSIDPKCIKNYSVILCILLKANVEDLRTEESNILLIPTNTEKEIQNTATIQDLQDHLLYIFAHAAEYIEHTKAALGHKERVIEKVKSYIDKNYSSELSLEEMSRIAYLSPSYLSYLFKSVTGETYSNYVKKVRMTHAKMLLKRLDLKVYEVADMVGYHEYKYFALQFKKMFGITPGDYR